MRGCFLVTNYNKQASISECMLSLLNQKYVNAYKDSKMDIIVIDDGSTDHSADILYHLEKTHESIKFIHRITNKGIGIRRNQLLQEAINGNYDFAIVMDSDDIAMDCLANNVIKVLSDGNDIVYNSYHMLDFMHLPLRLNVEAPKPEDITIMDGPGKQNISHGGLGISSKFFNVLYPEIKYGEDHEYLIKLMDAGAKFQRVEPVYSDPINNSNSPVDRIILNTGFAYIRSECGVSIKYKKEIEERDIKLFNMINNK